jgi:hypothetical protein
VVGRDEPSEDLRTGGRDQVRQAERPAGLDDQDGAQLPRAGVDVLEDRPVECAQVVEVVPARQTAPRELADPRQRQPFLAHAERGAVGEAEAVAEDAAARIQVRVAAHFR